MSIPIKPEDLGFNYEEFLEKNPKFKRSELAELRKWIEELDSSSVIPKDMHEKQLLIFYNACQMVVEDTKKCIKSYYSVRDNAPELFDDRNCELDLMKESLEILEYFILPGKTDEGYDVIFHRLRNYESSRYHFNHATRLLFMTIDACLYHKGPQPGFVFLFDMQGVKLSHITRCPITGVAKFCQYIQDALPANMKAIHVMNASAYFDKILMLLKPFVRKELLKMIKLHHEGDDMEKFYKEHIPKRLMPPDFGGETPDTQSLHNKNTELLKSLKPYFDGEENHRHLHSKKNKKKSKLDRGFAGLSID